MDEIHDEESDMEEENDRDKLKKLPEPDDKPKTDRYSMSRKRAERSKRLSLYMQLEEKKTAEFNNANSLLINYENKAVNNDKVIKSDLQNQMDSLKQKLERRSIYIYIYIGNIISYL